MVIQDIDGDMNRNRKREDWKMRGKGSEHERSLP